MDIRSIAFRSKRGSVLITLANDKAPGGYDPVAIDTPDAAGAQVNLLAEDLVGDIHKRIQCVHMLHAAGVHSVNTATAREVAHGLSSALASGSLLCYNQKPKRSIQVSDNTNSASASGGAKAQKDKKSQPSVVKKGGQSEGNPNKAQVNDTATEQSVDEQECRSDPISMLSGEEILPLVDFTLNAPMPLKWQRLYRSSKSDTNVGLGFGWRHHFALSIFERYEAPPKVGPKTPGRYWLELVDEQGRIHEFEKVKPGQTSYQLSSQLALHYQNDGKQTLVRPDDSHYTFFAGSKAWLLEKITDAKGQTLSFFYDANERLSRVAINDKRGVVLQYNGDDLLTKVAAYHMDDKDKRHIHEPLLACYQYNDAKQLVAVTDSQGNIERYSYRGDNVISKRTRASGFSHHFEWQGTGVDAKCIRQYGDNNTYEYSFEYPREGVSKSTDSRGNTETFVHNSDGKLVAYTDARGHSWRYRYDAFGNRTHTQHPDGSEERSEYNNRGQKVAQYDAQGNKTTFAYNQLGQHVLTRYADGGELKRAFTAMGLLQSQTLPDGRTSHYQYDDNNQLTTVVHSNGRSEQFSWSAQGELLAHQQGDVLTRFSYDELGRVNATLTNTGLLTQFERNAAGQLSAKVMRQEGDEHAAIRIEYHYDAAGRLTATTNGNGEQTSADYAGLAQPEQVRFADGSHLRYRYDKERNLIGITRSDGAEYRIDYDANENPIRTTGFDGRVQRFEFDAHNRVVALNDADERFIKLKRNALGQVIEQQAAHPNAKDSTLCNLSNYFSYDSQGRLQRAHNGATTLTQGFDQAGKLLVATQGQHTLNYSYDAFGRRSALTLADGQILNYHYDAQGQLARIELNGHTHVELSYRHGQLSEIHYANNITTKQEFDCFGRLCEQELSHPENALYAKQSYQYDGNNQLIASQRESSNSELSSDKQYQYNAINQLIEVNGDQSARYHWDSFGNPEQATAPDEPALRPVDKEHTAPALNNSGEDAFTGTACIDDRLYHLGQDEFDYDACGNQVHVLGKGQRQRLEYNALNQLASFYHNDQLTRYEYDPLGRRCAKLTEQGRIDYIWDGNQLLGECQNGQYTWYVSLPGEYQPLLLINDSGVYYYHLDQLDTPQFVTNAHAEVVWQNNTDAFGYSEQIELSPEHITQPLRFQGQYFDEESGLHYNRYRYYSPKQQRFINQDPIGLVGGINHYQYAPNPINWVDPLGLLCKEGQAKVKAAIDASSSIDPALAAKLIELSQLDVTPYTADEMIAAIKQGSGDALVNMDDPSALGSDNLTKAQRAHFRKKIDNAETDADDARYERNAISRYNRGLAPITREEWDKANETAKRNRKLGSEREKAAREALSKHKGESLVDNNNTKSSGGKVQQRSASSSDYKTRPDSLGDNIVHEHKHFTKDNSNPVAYNTKQLKEQRKAFAGKDHVLTLSSDSPCKNGLPPCRPSSKIKENSEVLYYDNEKNAITHRWNIKKQRWVKVKG